MPDPSAILARVRHHGANLAIEAGKLRIINRQKLPAGAERFIRDHYIDLLDLLRDEADEIEERAAIIEFDGNTPRAVAEQFARMCIAARHDPQSAPMLTEACGRIVDETFGRAAA